MNNYSSAFYEKPYTAKAHIHSLNGEMDEISVLEYHPEASQPYYIVDYNGVKAIFNIFTCSYYADDKYGRIEQ